MVAAAGLPRSREIARRGSGWRRAWIRVLLEVEFGQLHRLLVTIGHDDKGLSMLELLQGSQVDVPQVARVAQALLVPDVLG